MIFGWPVDLSCEGLGSDDEEGRLRVDLLQDLGDVGPVDV
jgi:hypothetical protein